MRLRVYTTRRSVSRVAAEADHIGICASADDPHPNSPHAPDQMQVVNEKTGKQPTLMADLGVSPDGLVRHAVQFSKRDCLHLVTKILQNRQHLGITDEELQRYHAALGRMLEASSNARAQ